MTASGYAASKDEANRALSAVGNPVTDAEAYTLFAIFDKPLDPKADYLITFDANGKSYGITSPATSRVDMPNCIKLYFQLTNGKQTDFVDREKATPETGAFDLGSFEGTAVMSVYRTDPQVEGTYPTGLSLIWRKTLEFAPTD